MPAPFSHMHAYIFDPIQFSRCEYNGEINRYGRNEITLISIGVGVRASNAKGGGMSMNVYVLTDPYRV